jgi:hypothetical protein
MKRGVPSSAQQRFSLPSAVPSYTPFSCLLAIFSFACFVIFDLNGLFLLQPLFETTRVKIFNFLHCPFLLIYTTRNMDFCRMMVTAC